MDNVIFNKWSSKDRQMDIEEKTFFSLRKEESNFYFEMKT